MKESMRRINAMFLRYLYLHKRSLPRTFEIFFWPVMDLLVWGFVTLYIQNLTQGELSRIIVFLINAMIFWDVLYRSQQGVSLSFTEDIWTQNIVNLLVSPLKIWEWLLATFAYGLVKTIIVTWILAVISIALYRFHLIQATGFYFIPLFLNLLLFGWAVGIFTAGLILRWGHAAEALIWGIPFLIQPLSAVFYPLSTLPAWLQFIARGIPSTYLFEGMREVIRTGTIPSYYFVISLCLNMVYFVLAFIFFQWMFSESRRLGRLGRLGTE